MKILFTICARKGSKGLKNKNISDFLKYPICYYTLSAYDLFVKNSSAYECELALNTDSNELVEQFKTTNIAFTHIPRTEELAGDRVGKIDVIKDTYIKMNKPYNYVIDIDLTSPLRTEKDIEGVLEALIENKEADLSFSMTTSRRSPYFNQVKKYENGFYKPVENLGAVSRQEVPSVYDMNASIYAYRPEFLLKAVKLFDGKAVAYEMKDTAVLDIDNPEDKELMENMALYFYDKYDDYGKIKKNIANIKNRE
ncbi:acylneuraminate cytidylyltransferase family protein [bacterium]|nr:acylneuraminate cytidylyltransferase family protein [bacterium]